MHTIFIFLLILFFIIGCKPEYKVDLTIEPFENCTDEPDLDDILYTRLTEELPPVRQASNFILKGKIIEYKKLPVSFDKKEYILFLKIKIFIFDKQKNRNFYQKEYIINQSYTYSDEQRAKQILLQELTKEMVLELCQIFIKQR
jgi:hypothetical protein